MKLPKMIAVALLLTQVTYAQKTVVNEYAAVDKKALQIPTAQAQDITGIAKYINDNFTTEENKARAAFIWVASNLKYDVDNMYAINFYEKTEDRVAKTFHTHKGICVDYATIFNAICNQCGIQSFVVSGYTKQNGVADYLAHAWCVAYLNNDWYVFDPTWGSGYLSNGKFVGKVNNEYFKSKPGVRIKSHMPFDPLWECLNYPVTNAEFYEGKIQPNTTKPYFSYKDSIKAWAGQTQMEQYMASARRIEQNGVKNALIFDRLEHIKREMEYTAGNASVSTYNDATADYNTAIANYNVFINYRNKQFKPQKPDEEIKSMIDVADNDLAKAKAKLASIQNPQATITSLITALKKSIDEAQKNVDEQKAFVTKYLSKGVLGRKSMFTKITWMGLPVN